MRDARPDHPELDTVKVDVERVARDAIGGERGMAHALVYVGKRQRALSRFRAALRRREEDRSARQ